MNMEQRLLSLKENQQKLLTEYDSLVKDYDATGIIRQNEALKQQLADATDEVTQLQASYNAAIEENQKLRLNLREQIFDEKFNIVKLSQTKLNTYFKNSARDCDNRLTALESHYNKEINKLKSAAHENLADEQKEFTAELDQAAQRLREKIRSYRAQIAAQAEAATGQMAADFDSLSAEAVSDAVLQKRVQQNETELKIGLHWINKIGILLILFGIGAAAKYAHSTWFNDYMRGTSFFLLGGVFLAGGEWMYRHGKTAFSTGLLGGGAAILYCAVFYSYFLLHIINIYAGLFISVLITLSTVVLSLRYHSKTICSLGLIGGYLPFFTFIATFGIQQESCYIAMIYLLLLNLSVLGISYQRRWHSINYLGMMFHIPAMIYLVFHADNVWIGMAYTIAAFTIHLLIQLAYPLKHAVNIKQVDLILIGINTFLSCAVLYGLLQKGGLSDYNGLLALTFCLVYAQFGKFIEKKIPTEKFAQLIFYAVSLTFAILMIPFQLGIRWMSMGWLVESVIFIIYGLKHKMESLEKSGWGILLFCLGSFYFLDFLQPGRPYFDYKFTAITLGTIAVAAAYLKNSQTDGMARYGRFWDLAVKFKYFAILNTWLYLQYMSGQIYSAYMPRGEHFTLYRLLLMVIVNLGLAYGICRIALLYSKAVKCIALFLYALSIFLCVFMNLCIPVIKNTAAMSGAEYGAIAVLIMFNLCIVMVARKLLITTIEARRLNFEYYPLGIIIYLLGNVTILLSVQFQLSTSHIISSLIVLFAALASLVYGFRKNYIYTRRFGLGLSIFATAKLFLFDLMFLDTFNKMIAYFVFGFVLLGISYLYQRLRSAAEGGKHDQTM